MAGKVEQLAEKLLKEGVEKGEAEKKKILDAAQTEAAQLRKEAEEKAESIIAEAEKKAEEMKKNAESEIKLAGEQSIGALKQKITDLISLTTVDSAITEALSDAKVMEEYIKVALNNWKGDEASLEVILPDATKAEMEGKLAKAIEKAVKAEVTISYSKAVKGGFQIAPSDGGYKITFSDSDFAGFFNDFLRPKIRTILFGE